jgi:peptidoglycan/xylan/chitin deacetylase (PgdA/CDA1 family)
MKKNLFGKIIVSFFILAVFLPGYLTGARGADSKIKEIITKPDFFSTLSSEPQIRSVKEVLGVQTQALDIYLPVLMYHHVGETQGLNNSLDIDLTVTPSDFEQQLEYFKQQGFVSISVAKATEFFESGKEFGEKYIIFTFDDGYSDVFINAVPILIKHGFVGSFAIATDLLGRPGYANWDQVKAAKEVGMEILSHSRNHLDLASAKYSEQDLQREIFESKKILEEKLGTVIESFVYPYGRYNDRVVELVKQVGYKIAFTTNFGDKINTSAALISPRIRVHGENGLQRLKKVMWR